MVGELLLKCPKCKYEIAMDRLEASMKASEARQMKKKFNVKCPKCGSEMEGVKEWQT